MTNLSGIPDVDLSAITDDLKAKAQDKAPAKEEGSDLAQFKDPQALLEGYKNVQSYSTKVSQENKELQARLAEIEEKQRLMAHAQPMPKVTETNFGDRFYEDPQGAISQEVQSAVVKARITEVLEEEDLKDTENFQERYQWAMMAKQISPQLGGTPAGVRMLFKEGDKLKKASLKKNAIASLEHVFGEALTEEELITLRELVKGKKKTTTNLNAYMPDIDSSTKTGADTDQKIDIDSHITNAERSGDIDGVIKGLFAKAMAE